MVRVVADDAKAKQRKELEAHLQKPDFKLFDKLIRSVANVRKVNPKQRTRKKRR